MSTNPLHPSQIRATKLPSSSLNPGTTTTNVTLLTTKPKADVDPAASRLKKAWRTYASSIAVISSRATAAEKAASKNNTTSSSSSAATNTNSAENKKRSAFDDDSCFITTFKANSELKKMIGLIESRIKNESREKELLQSFWRSEPFVSTKRIKIDSESNGNAVANDENKSS